MKPTFFVYILLFFLIALSPYPPITLSPYRLIPLSPYYLITHSARAQTITISATVDEHLSWRKDGNNLIISTNKSEGFILITNGERITKKGPVVLTVPYPKSFVITSGY